MSDWQFLGKAYPHLFWGIPWLPQPRAPFSLFFWDAFLYLFGVAAFGAPYFFVKTIAYVIIEDFHGIRYLDVILDSLVVAFLAYWVLDFTPFVERLKAFMLGSRVDGKRWLNAHFTSSAICLLLLVWIFWPPSPFAKIPEGQGATLVIVLYCKLVMLALCFLQLRSDLYEIRSLRGWIRQRGQDYPDMSPLNLSSLPTGDFTTICHFTDLHLTRAVKDTEPAGSPLRVRDRKTLSGEARHVWNRFRRILEKHTEEIENANAILLTGDITDTGAPSEWELFFDAFYDRAHLLKKTVILPGNHDVNIFHSLPFFLADDSDAHHRKLNLVRFLYALNYIQGDRTHIVSSSGEFVLFSDWFAQFAADLGRFYTAVPIRTYTAPVVINDTALPRQETTPDAVKALIDLPDKVFFEAFPMVTTVDNVKASFLLLDSNMPSSNIVTNAFGALNERQTILLDAILQEFSEREVPVVVGLHHHVGNPPSNLMPRGRAAWEDRGLTLVNPMSFLRAFPGDRSYAIFNGHRHLRYTGRFKNLSIVSGPSTTLGDSSHRKIERVPGFGIYGLAWTDDGNLEQIYERWF